MLLAPTHHLSLLGVCKGYKGASPSLSPSPCAVLLAQRGQFSVAVVLCRSKRYFVMFFSSPEGQGKVGGMLQGFNFLLVWSLPADLRLMY